MSKIMLVEDDKSLREIYGVRLLAEGYDIVSAGDGEEALAIAIKERPQLIISDVMMPKVSGYDMLDILRSTTETRNIKVIMMTALSSEEQRQRAESLGADRYLVKSQVGIEDVVRVVHEILADTPETAAQPTPRPSTPTTPSTPPTTASPTPGTTPSAPPVAPTAATSVSAPKPAPISTAPKPASLKSRVIQPLNDPNVAPVNINDLLDKELSKEAGLSDEERPAVTSISQEKAAVEAQIKAFTPPTPVEPTPVEPVSEPIRPLQVAPVLPTPGVSSAASKAPDLPPTISATPEEKKEQASPQPAEKLVENNSPTPSSPVPVSTPPTTPPLPDVPKV